MKVNIDPKTLYHELGARIIPEKFEKCILFLLAAMIFLLIPLKEIKVNCIASRDKETGAKNRSVYVDIEDNDTWCHVSSNGLTKIILNQR